MKTIFFRTPYNYDTNKVSDETGLSCSEPTLAQQSFKEDSDINVILERFNITGELPPASREPQYGDFLDSPVDYKSAMDVVMSAQSAFNALPARLRARFDNDAAKFVDFVGDDKNRNEAYELGLLDAAAAAVSAQAEGAPGAQAPGDAQLPT